MSFDPNSPNAMFAVILERLKVQDGILLDIRRDGEETKAQTQKTNGRVTVLEDECVRFKQLWPNRDNWKFWALLVGLLIISPQASGMLRFLVENVLKSIVL